MKRSLDEVLEQLSQESFEPVLLPPKFANAPEKVRETDYMMDGQDDEAADAESQRETNRARRRTMSWRRSR